MNATERILAALDHSQAVRAHETPQTAASDQNTDATLRLLAAAERVRRALPPREPVLSIPFPVCERLVHDDPAIIHNPSGRGRNRRVVILAICIAAAAGAGAVAFRLHGRPLRPQNAEIRTAVAVGRSHPVAVGAGHHAPAPASKFAEENVTAGGIDAPAGTVQRAEEPKQATEKPQTGKRPFASPAGRPAAEGNDVPAQPATE